MSTIAVDGLVDLDTGHMLPNVEACETLTEDGSLLDWLMR